MDSTKREFDNKAKRLHMQSFFMDSMRFLLNKKRKDFQLNRENKLVEKNLGDRGIGMKLRIELFVENIEESVEFYSTVLGFTVPKVIDKNYVPVTNGNVEIGLAEMRKLPDNHPIKSAEGEQKGLGVEIVLEVEDLQSIYNNVVDHGYPIHAELSKQPWGDEDFRIVDPDGYYLRITSY